MSNHNFEEEVSQAKYNGLHIQKGDVLEISVQAFDNISATPFNKNSMSQVSTVANSSGSTSTMNTYQVSTEGTVNLPVLGDVYCAGMTKQQLKEDLENRLKRYLTDPLVTIKLTNFNFSVLGEVGSPGQKTSTTEKLNIFQALALSGDINTGGNRTNVKIIRNNESENKDEIITINLTEGNIINSPYYYLQQNDIIYVEPDRNKQIAVNSDANVDKLLKYGGVALGIISIAITLIIRLK